MTRQNGIMNYAIFSYKYALELKLPEIFATADLKQSSGLK
jgi:hypothetical protein